MSELLWEPNKAQAKNSPVSKLQDSLHLKSYEALHLWSTENLDDFWSRVWDSANIIGFKGRKAYISADYFPEAKFFPEALLNVAENLLTNEFESEIAITSISESGEKIEISWSSLRKLVAAVANALLSEGVKPGDRVVAWSSNSHHTMIYSIAGLSIGAVISTASPDFAAAAILDRFSQIEPVVMLAASSYQYNGKIINCLDNLGEIISGLPSLRKVVLIDTVNSNYDNWDSWIKPYKGRNIEFPRFAFDHPGFILFSSGTTGKPKCIVHRSAGILLKLRAEQIYSFNINEQDKVFFFTTCGWMMWNWLLYILAASASIVLYEGSPTHPRISRLVEIAGEQRCTHLGVSAKYIDLLRNSQFKTEEADNLEKLEMIMSTGSVLSPDGFKYIYQNIKSNLHLASISGGTDICGCFIASIPVVPVFSGELQGACLGMDVQIFDESGVEQVIDEKGELVCLKPFPSMPIGFWNDPSGEKYREAYFAKYTNIWTHGDFASKTKNAGFIIHGRSDATLNSNGVRIGTSEIYKVVESLPEVREALAVGYEFENDFKMILFVILQPNILLTSDIEQKIKTQLRVQASPRHIPNLILSALEFPRTKSNKLVEIIVADLLNQRTLRNIDALSNPESLEWFKELNLEEIFISKK